MTGKDILKSGSLCLVGAVIAVLSLQLTSLSKHEGNWHLIYSHDETGKALSGSKEELMDAVRSGKAVRIYWRGRRVEHAVDANFLTIFGGEVFAQIAPIQSQAPSLDPPAIAFREPGQQWRSIIGTDGSAMNLMDGNEPRSNTAARKWYVHN